jgi:hypothetical protein
MQVVEVIPFKNFKERLQLVIPYTNRRKYRVEIFESYLYIETLEYFRKQKRRKGSDKKTFRK